MQTIGMKLLGSLAILIWGCFAAPETENEPLNHRCLAAPVGWNSGTAGCIAPQQVAIIGAGAAGSSAAYHLTKFASESGIPVNITILEKTGRIGGRTLTVNAYDDPNEPVELGASIFIKLNHILYGSASLFNLSLVEPGPNEDERLVIWDGARFVYETSDSQWEWWKLAKLFWKYGRAPYKAQKLMKATVAQFLKLYEAPYFPFRSLTTTAYELGLTKVTGLTGEQYLAQNQIGSAFSRDIIQAATRVNYASNLGQIHGLDAMVAIAPDGAAQVTGGNWQIFDRMVKATNSSLRLNAAVTSVTLETPEDSSVTPGYVLTWKALDSDSTKSTTHRFDKIIMATPHQFSDIDFGKGVLQRPIDEIPYVKLHVTLFTSRFRIDPVFFGKPAGTEVPTTVLTTLGEDEDSSSGAGKAGFFSISSLRTVVNPVTSRTEYLYKIFSPEKVSAEFLSSLLGVEVPETITGQSTSGGDSGQGQGVVDPISWFYPHVFYSYPQALPRLTFQDPILGPGIYYTSGIESFISTMETSALMGKNAARLMVDDIITAAKGEAAAGTADHVIIGGQGNEGSGQVIMGEL